MRGGRRQHRRRQAGIIRTMLACLDGGKRLCGEVDASIGTGRPPLFAPLSPLALMPSSRGAKSSHSRRRISPSRAPGGRLSLLPAPRYPLCLRFGEQNLHISAAGFRHSARPAASSLCSPTPANPCDFVSGSKIFTFPPAAPAQTFRRPPPHNKRKAPGSAIAARCFSLFSLSIIPIPLLPPAQS